MRGLMFGCVACGAPSSPTTTTTTPLPTAPAASVLAPTPITDAGTAAIDAGASSGATAARDIVVTPVPLAGTTDPAFLDYIAHGQGRIWLPFVSGKSGAIDVFDIAGGTFSQVTGLKVVEREAHGKMRALGPSSVTLGDGVAYFGNRGTSEVCVVDATTLKLGKCLKLSTPPDGVAYVASAHEVWVTTPQTQSITVLDATNKNALKLKTTIKTDGDPEGYAVDDAHDAFFTNLEDKDRTLRIAIKTHKVTATWSPSCGAEGPRGLAIDSERQLLVVACTDHLQALSAARDGALLGKLDTGAGVDNLATAHSLIYAAAGKAARLTVAKLDDLGTLSVVAAGTTADGARNAVADENGTAYLVDGKNARLLVVKPAP